MQKIRIHLNSFDPKFQKVIDIIVILIEVWLEICVSGPTIKMAEAVWNDGD